MRGIVWYRFEHLGMLIDAVNAPFKVLILVQQRHFVVCLYEKSIIYYEQYNSSWMHWMPDYWRKLFKTAKCIFFLCKFTAKRWFFHPSWVDFCGKDSNKAVSRTFLYTWMAGYIIRVICIQLMLHKNLFLYWNEILVAIYIAFHICTL